MINLSDVSQAIVIGALVIAMVSFTILIIMIKSVASDSESSKKSEGVLYYMIIGHSQRSENDIVNSHEPSQLFE